MYNFKLNLRSFLKKKLHKSYIIKLGGVYNTGLQFLKTFQVPGKWADYSERYFPAENEY